MFGLHTLRSSTHARRSNPRTRAEQVPEQSGAPRPHQRRLVVQALQAAPIALPHLCRCLPVPMLPISFGLLACVDVLPADLLPAATLLRSLLAPAAVLSAGLAAPVGGALVSPVARAGGDLGGPAAVLRS